MAFRSSEHLRSPEEIATQAAPQVPFLRLPDRRTAFTEREMRLRERAAGHPMGDFLNCLAEIAHCQHEVLQCRWGTILPDRNALEAAARRGEPPLAANAWPRDRAWRGHLRHITERLLPSLEGTAAHASVLSLRGVDDAWLEGQADRLLEGEMPGLDLSTSPVIAAALQTYWTDLVLSTHQAYEGWPIAPIFGRIADATVCPCCGSRPNASVVRIGGDAAGYRYLHCGLCSTQWHMVRIKCSHCQQTKGIEYLSLQTHDCSRVTPAAVEVEACRACRRYLKIMHMERDVEVEPIADDLASVMLDLLVSEAGLERDGFNPMLLFGSPGPTLPHGGLAEGFD